MAGGSSQGLPSLTKARAVCKSVEAPGHCTHAQNDCLSCTKWSPALQSLWHWFPLHLVLLCPCQAVVLGPDMAVPTVQLSQDKVEFSSLCILLGLTSEVFRKDSTLVVLYVLQSLDRKEWAELGNPSLISQEKWSCIAYRVAKTYGNKAEKTGWNQNPNAAILVEHQNQVSTSEINFEVLYLSKASFKRQHIQSMLNSVLLKPANLLRRSLYTVCVSWYHQTEVKRARIVCAWGVRVAREVWTQFFSGPRLSVWRIWPPPHCTGHAPSFQPPAVSPFCITLAWELPEAALCSCNYRLSLFWVNLF